MKLAINVECEEIGTLYGVVLDIMMQLDRERLRQGLTPSDAFTESVVFEDANCYGGYSVVLLAEDGDE